MLKVSVSKNERPMTIYSQRSIGLMVGLVGVLSRGLPSRSPWAEPNENDMFFQKKTFAGELQLNFSGKARSLSKRITTWLV